MYLIIDHYDSGLGMALVSRWIVRKELNAKELTTILIKGKRLFFLMASVRGAK